jgi:hypothetical protein
MQQPLIIRVALGDGCSATDSHHGMWIPIPDGGEVSEITLDSPGFRGVFVSLTMLSRLRHHTDLSEW